MRLRTELIRMTNGSYMVRQKKGWLGSWKYADQGGTTYHHRNYGDHMVFDTAQKVYDKISQGETVVKWTVT